MDSAFKLPKLKCLRCRHEWIPRKAARPRRCPRCKSPYWNVPRITKEGQKPKSRINGN